MPSFRDKILETTALVRVCESLRQSGKAIVTTNGCFDLLHVGHVTYLETAKALGDILIVAVNSDRSVSTLKGALRPITCQIDRALLLAAIGSVDYVTIFEEPSPVELLKLLKPNVHVKGGDYDDKSLVERDVVEAHGGEIRCVEFTDGYSTTRLLERIKSVVC